MVNRVQTLRSSVPGTAPAPGTRQPGELYVNFPDNALGVIDPTQNPVDLIPVRYFSSLASYFTGDCVLQNGRIYVATGIFYLAYQIFSGNYRQSLFVPRDLAGVWPMVRHYFFFGRKPAQTGVYNPLQKMAYTSAILLGLLSMLTGIVLYNPVQFSFLALLMGGFHRARLWHFCVLCALLLFVLGHLIMVILHGWNNFTSMLTGWKRNPEYLP